MLKIKKLSPHLKLPTKTHEGDAGWDLYATRDKIMRPGERYQFSLGFAIEGERGKVYRTEGKSSLAKIHGITTIGNVIDNNYRGEVSVVLVNTSKLDDFVIEKGDKIAQLVIYNVDDDNQLELVKELSKTSRGEGGFGSTGRK